MSADMRPVRRLWPMVLTILSLLSCQTPTDYYRKLLYVTAMLDPGEPYQPVVLDHSYRLTDTIPYGYSWQAGNVCDASVKLWPRNSAGWDTECLEPEETFMGTDWGDCWEYRAYRPLRPCSTYEISVRWRDTIEQKDFAGHMTVTLPDTFSITSPCSMQTIVRDSIPLFSWRRSTNASCYVLLAQEITYDTFRQSYEVTGTSYPYVTADTALDVTQYRDVLFYENYPAMYIVSVFAWNDDLYRQKIRGANRFAVDTIGEDVIADYGAETHDRVVVFYRP